MKKILFSVIITIAFPSLLQAQDSVQLSLANAIEATLKNNHELTLANLDQQIASSKYNQTNSVFLPQLNLSYTAFTTNNPLNAFGFKLQQQSITSSDFNPQLLNNPSAIQNFTTKVELNQPIINMDMFALRKAARAQVDIYVYKTKRMKEYLAFEAQRAYAELQVAQQAVIVLNEALQSVKVIYKSTNEYYEKGLVQKSDLLQVQVQVATTENKLAEAKSNVKNACDYLSLLMGNKIGVAYTTTTVALEKSNSHQVTSAQISTNRADFMAMQSAVDAQNQVVHSGKFLYFPKLNVFANYFFNDKTVFGFKSNSYLAGAQFSWNVFSGLSNHNKISEYKFEQKKVEQQLVYQKEQAQLELNKTIRQMQDVELNVQRMETVVAQATESLRILKNRYDHGLVSTTDLLNAQTLLSQQKLVHAQTVMQYAITRAYLQFLTTSDQ